MTIQIQWPGDAESLQLAFGLKGPIRLVSDEVVAPTVKMQDLPESPWSSHKNVASGGVFVTAGVGDNAGMMAIPGTGVTMGINEITVRNNTGGTFIVHVGIIPPIVRSLVTEGTPVDFRNLTNGVIFQGGTNGTPVTGSRLIPIQNAGIVGAIWLQTQVGGPALGDDVLTIRLPNTPYVDGDLVDETGQAGGVVIWNNTTNTEMTVSMAGREYPNRK